MTFFTFYWVYIMEVIKMLKKNKEKQVEKKKDIEEEEQKEEEKRIRLESRDVSPPSSEERKLSNEKRADERREEIEELDENERKLLVVLDFVYKNKGRLRVTGFQIKDFLELIFPEIDVDKVYSKLKEKEYVSRKKDFEDFWLTYRGEEEAKKYRGFLNEIFEKISQILESSLRENPLLKRALYLSYLDEWKFKSQYLPNIKDQLSEEEQVLSIFISSKDFLQLPLVEKLVREIKKEIQFLLQEELEKLCKDDDFLKALLVLKIEELIDELSINVFSTIYHGNYVENISYLIEGSRINEVLAKLLHLGITPYENLFEINIKKALLKKENIQRLREMLKFDEKGFEEEIQKNWDLIVDLKRVLDGKTPDNIEKFVKMNALIPSKAGFIVRNELKGICDRILNRVEKKLKEKVGDFPNVIILPFYDKNKVKDVEGKIVITFEGDIEDENILEKNIVLKVSPKEIGIETVYDKNEEYNAIKEMENLEEIKSKLDTCKWIRKDDEYYVKKAKEIIEDKKIPKISFEDALERLKEDFRLIEILYLIADKHTCKTAIKNKYYSISDLWSYVWQNLKIMYPNLTEDEFNKLKEKVVFLIERKARLNLLLDVFSKEKEIIYNKFKDKFIQKIKERVKLLDKRSKQTLFVFLKKTPEHPSYIKDENWLHIFKIMYKFMFGEEFKDNLEEILIKLGVANKGTWYSSSGNIYYDNYHFIPFLSEIKDEIEKELEKEVLIQKPKLEEFKEKYKNNIIELIALDYLLFSKGICRREKLRDFLWEISLKAWETFESYETVISSKEGEMIAINPIIIDKLKEFIKARKKELLEEAKGLIEILKSFEKFGIDLILDDDLSIYRGIIRMENNDEINIIIAPWYIPQYDKFFGRKTLVIVTHQPDYKQIVKMLKEKYGEFISVFLKGKKFNIYSSFKDNSLANIIRQMLIEKGYKSEIEDFEFKELEKVEEGKHETLEISEVSKLSVPEENILDEIFTPSPAQKGFSSLFDTNGKPKCIIITGDGSGKKIIEDLIKEELKYWGDPTPLVKQIDTITAGHEGRIKGAENVEIIEDIKEVISLISNPKYKVVSITLSSEFFDWIGKIIEKLKEVESQGLRYIIFYVEEKVKKNFLRELQSIRERTAIPIYTFNLPPIEKIPGIEYKLIEFFGYGMDSPEFRSLDIWWNDLQRKILEIQRKFKEKIFEDEDISFRKLDNETNLHYIMKAIVYKYLKLRGYEVEVEESKDIGGVKRKIDLVAHKDRKEIYIEVETGMPTKEEIEEHGGYINPEERLMSEKKIGKYISSDTSTKDVILVVPNIFGIIHRKMLRGLRKYFKKHNVNLSVYMINWSSDYSAKLIKLEGDYY